MVVGVGGCRDVDGAEVLELVCRVLDAAGRVRLRELATVAEKAREPGLLATARRLGVPLRAFPAAELATVPHVAASATARAAFGTASVAEAAALLAAGRPYGAAGRPYGAAERPYGAVGAARLLVAKTRSAASPARATAAVATAATGEDRDRTT